MKNKIQAIWHLIIAKNYMVITPQSYTASYPESSNDAIIAQWGKAFSKWKETQDEEV